MVKSVRIFCAVVMVFLCLPGWSIPLEVLPGELGSYEMKVSISIDGNSRDFQLDTGADSTIVAPDEQMLAYPSLGKASSKGASGTRTECDLIEPAKVVFDKITVFSARLKRCNFGEHSLNNLGMDILSGHILEIDSRAETLEFLNAVPVGEVTHPLERLEKGHARMRVDLMEKAVGAIFDTGAQLTAIDLKYAEENPGMLKRIGNVEAGRDISGNPVKMVLYEIPRVHIGGVDFHDVSSVAFDFKSLREYLGGDTPLIIGNNLILQAHWIIDLKENQWAVYRRNLQARQIYF